MAGKDCSCASTTIVNAVMDPILKAASVVEHVLIAPELTLCTKKRYGI